MKKYIYIISAISTILLSVVSCTPSYYYTQVASPNNNLSRKPGGDFVFENDSLWIAYMFGGENAPIYVSIGNKLEEPLFIDWNQSSLLIGDQRYPYIQTKQTFDLQKIQQTDSVIKSRETMYPSTTAGAKLNQLLPQGIESIPAGYNFSGVLAWINPDVVAYQERKKYVKHKIVNKNGQVHSVKKLNFEENDSPLRFSSIISYHFGNSTTKNADLFSDFYVKNVIKSSTSPQQMNQELVKRNDVFYTYIPPNPATAQIIGATAVTMGFIILDATLSRNNDY